MNLIESERNLYQLLAAIQGNVSLAIKAFHNFGAEVGRLVVTKKENPR